MLTMNNRDLLKSINKQLISINAKLENIELELYKSNKKNKYDY